MKYIQNEYEINVGDNIQLISNKYKFDFNLVKKENFINLGFLGEFLDNLFEYRCCGCSAKDKGNYDVFNNSINISQILDMSAAEALEFFAPIPKIARKLQTINDVGLGYLKLGQSSTTLSGGEAQRVKLATELNSKIEKSL